LCRRISHRRFAEYVRVPTNHLVGDRAGYLREAEPAGFFGHARVVDDLEQQIAQFVRQCREVVARDGVGNFIRFLDGVRRDAVEGLQRIPGTAMIRVTQRRHDVEQTTKLGFRGLHQLPENPARDRRRNIGQAYGARERASIQISAHPFAA
jgi:hypothetical protein